MEKINEVELKPAIERFYLDYAVAVITDRALPNASDGLKPVHRRTLFGANDLKIFSNSSFRKSAALVGHVMGDYHPHGDCVASDTEFLLTSGEYMTIYDMYLESLENPDVSYDVYSLDKKGNLRIGKLTHPRIGQRTKTIYEITLSNGSKLKVTSNHPIALSNMEFKKAEELKVGDILKTYPFAYEFNAPADGTIPFLSLFGNNKEIFKAININDIPQELNEEAQKLFKSFDVIYIQDIKVTERKKLVNMYDFTVEGFENALIWINDELLCIHNSAIYDATVLLTQPFSTRYPLFEGQGNFGNIDGDSAAAYRYSEIRLSPYGEMMLDGVNNNVVPMVENYDGEHLEPTVLPSKIPNMIINGSSGIAVAMSTNMPPHNLRETVNAIELVINNPEATTDDILSVMPGPDFPLGGIIRELSGIRDYFDTGRGKFAIESKWSFERVGRHNNIYFTEIPYGVNKSKIVQKIAELIDQEAYEGLMSVEDESNIEGIKIVVKAAENVDIENLVQFLFKKTPLSNNFNAINLALDEKGKPKIYTMKDLIITYINHQRMVYSNDAINNIKSLDKSIKIANALIKASSQIKKVVEIIEKSKDTETVRAKLKKLLDVDDESVTYILDLQLRRIQKIEKKKQEDDLKELEAKRAEYQKRLDEPYYLNKVIIFDLKNIVNKIKDERRTLITDSEMSVKTTTQKFKILYSDNKLRVENLDYYVKKVDMEEIKGLIETDSGSVALVIQKDGSAIAINNYTLVEKVKEIENISTVVSISYDTDDDNLYLFTKNGMVKAISLELLLDTIGKKDNFEVIGLESGDEVVAAFTDKENSSVIAYNNGGKFIRASLSDVRPMGLPAKGVMFMKLDKDVSVIDVNSTSDKSTLFYVKDGALSSVALDSINIQGRAGQGRMLFENKAAIPANFQNEIFISGDKVLVLK